MLSYIIPIFIAALIIGYILGKPIWKEQKRNKLKQQPFKKEWRKIIQHRIPYFRTMPADLQLQLKKHIQVFLDEKEFVGCNGVVINDEIRVTIAAQACMLLLNRKTDYYPRLKTILVYPRAFVKQQQNKNADGLFFNQQVALAGESWEFGKVILSWQDTVEGALDPNDGRNLVIHEFAHQLDQESGSANGAPILGKNQNYETWSSVFNRQFKQLQNQLEHNQHSLFDYYGATNPAEFFAVASEVFFERAHEMNHYYPEIYQQLKLYYNVDPNTWR